MRGIVAILVLLTPVAVAGCLGGTDAPASADPPVAEGSATAFGTPAPDAETDRTLRFATLVALPQRFGASEPSLAFAADGTRFVAAPTGLQDSPNVIEGAAYLWRSDDGLTWQTLRTPDAVPIVTNPFFGNDGVGAFCSCDADVATSPDGWTYYTDWWIAGLALGNYLVERSADGGATWDSVPVTVPMEEAQSVDRQWLLAGPDGFVGLFYGQLDAPLFASGFAIDAIISHDHGASWSEPVRAVEGDTHTNWIAHPILLDDGTLLVPHAKPGTDQDRFESGGEVRVARSDDGGATWEVVRVARVPDGFGNLWPLQGAADDAGNVYLAWAEIADDGMRVVLSSSQDVGATWTEPNVLRAEGANFLPWVAARGDGTVAVGWYGGDTTTADPREAPEDAPWFAWVAESHDGGRSGTLVKVSDQPVKIGPLCPRGAACDGDRELLDFLSVAYGPDGRLHVAFAHETPADGFLDAKVLYSAAIGPTAEPRA